MAGTATKAGNGKGSKTKASNEEVTKRNAAKAAERKQASEEKKAAKVKAKQAERDAAIKAGTLIVDGNTEFHKVDKEDLGTVEQRATSIVEALKASPDKPVLGRQLMTEFGGGWPQYLSIFSLLKTLGMVEEYRARGGERGRSGVAYRWVGK